MSRAFRPTFFFNVFHFNMAKEVYYTVKQLYVLFYIVFIIFM